MANTNFMTQQNIMLVKDLVDENTSQERIIRATGLTEKQIDEILIRLRARDDMRTFEGITSFFEPSLCTRETYCKQMGYVLDKPVPNLGYVSADRIVTPNYEPVSILFCSDPHACSVDDQINLIDKMWDKAAERSIRHVINDGDLTEGTEYHIHKHYQTKIRVEPTIDKELEYLNNFLPFDKNITHHVNQGNHDIYKNNGHSIDLVKELKDRYGRPDIVTCGIEQSIIPINNDFIHLIHRPYVSFIVPYLKKFENCEETQIMYCGHGHFPHDISCHPAYDVIFLPATCDQPRGNDAQKAKFYMGFVISTIVFDTKTGLMKYIYHEPFKYDPFFDKLIDLPPREVHVRRLTK